MTIRGKALIARGCRLSRSDGRMVVVINNDPETPRLRHLGLLPTLSMMSNREAMIDTDHFKAAPDESVKTFRARLETIAQAQLSRLQPRERAIIIRFGYPSDAVSPVRSTFSPDEITTYH